MEQILQAFGARQVQLSDLTYPLDATSGSQQELGDGAHRLLVIANDNLMEMMEEVLEEEASIAAFVEGQLAKIAELTRLDAWREIVQSFLTYTDLPAEVKNTANKSEAELYAAYARVWEGERLLDETVQPPQKESQRVTLNQQWVEHRQEDVLLQVPLTRATGWQAPLIVPMGGFNECPVPHLQALLFREWQQSYDVMPLVVTADTWVLQAGKVPVTDEEALQLAREHFMLCQYVMDAFATLGEYAYYLQHHTVWYFWWD